MEQEPPNLVLSLLREMRGDLNKVMEDVRGIRVTQAAHGRLLGELTQTTLRTEADYIGLLGRVERIEQRLGLAEAPTAQ